MIDRNMSDNTNNTIKNEASEKQIMETHANTAFVMLGFVAVPLWLTLLDFKIIRGYSIFKSLQMTFLNLCQEPIFIAALVVLELLIVVALIRMRNQKIILTDKRVLIYTVQNFGKGFFKVIQKDLPLTEIKSVHTRLDGGFFERRFKCATIVIEPIEGKEIMLEIMNNPIQFADQANYYIAKNKK